MTRLPKIPASRFPLAPPQIAALKLDQRGFPVPWFVPWFKGEPEFRAVDPARIKKAHAERLCWICGRHMSTMKCFVVGPMCTANRVAPEPPSHPVCGRFAVTGCPFLSRPMAKRRDTSDLPHRGAAGVMLEHNPGAIALWHTRSYRTEHQPEGGVLFRLGSPVWVDWFAEGRKATREEVLAGFAMGLPKLRAMAELDGPEGVALFEKAIDRALKWVPAA